jgi:PadR family transcriptional regulator PadR
LVWKKRWVFKGGLYETCLQNHRNTNHASKMEILMARETMGEFEQLVILALLRCGGSAYGVPVVREIQERTKREASAAAVYISLKRLEKKGCTVSQMSDPSAERGGKARRVFSVTSKGKDSLLESRRAMQQMWDGLEVLPDEA